jgi:hypothetical protein
MATIALTASATIMRAARGMGRRYARESAGHGVPYLGFRGHGPILSHHSLGVCCGLNRPRSASRASRKRSAAAVSTRAGRVLRRPEGPLVRTLPMLALAAADP